LVTCSFVCSTPGLSNSGLSVLRCGLCATSKTFLTLGMCLCLYKCTHVLMYTVVAGGSQYCRSTSLEFLPHIPRFFPECQPHNLWSQSLLGKEWEWSLVHFSSEPTGPTRAI
jgi:hypothetical protein